MFHLKYTLNLSINFISWGMDNHSFVFNAVYSSNNARSCGDLKWNQEHNLENQMQLIKL